jgi:hypothetical protein
MWSEQFTSMLVLVVMASLLRASWELSREQSLAVEPGADKVQGRGSNLYAATSPKGAHLAPWQREWAEKAVRGYREAQDKKWRRWNEAMFERSG